MNPEKQEDRGARPGRDTRYIAFAALLALAVILGSAASASAAAGPLDESMTGVAIGEKAPDFTLNDQDGNEVTLASLLSEGNVALVFYRSADW